MNYTCARCKNSFEVSPFEADLRKKIAPTLGGKKYYFKDPTLCPDCRFQRRFAYRNERKLYSRTCNKTGDSIISIYSPDKTFPVYAQDVWWSDEWDGRDYGQEYDFSKSFFEQYKELSDSVPHPNTVNMFSENSLYSNHAAGNKNCYMVCNTGWSEDCLYVSNYTIYSKDCVDCLAINKCECCYFCTNTRSSSFSSYLFECESCANCYYCYDCRSCQDCFMCWNLRQKRFCIENVQYTEKEYREKIKEIHTKTIKEADKRFEEFIKHMREDAIHKATTVYGSERVSGDYITNCKNVHDTFYSFNSEDVIHCYDGAEMKDCVDITEPYTGELHFETHACNQGTNLVATSKCYEDNYVFYSQYCWTSKFLFGCFGLKRNEYCILNKQYTKEEYEELLPKIIEHMQQTGEWGEFFPVSHAPNGYNETVANEYFPLTKKEALEQGFTWSDYEAPVGQVSGEFTKDSLPQRIEEATNELINHVITCSVSGRPFKLVAPELEFYRRFNIPLPHKHPDERHKDRFNLRNPRKLWQRNCMKCNEEVESTYAPNRPETIYCEECYNKEIY